MIATHLCRLTVAAAVLMPTMRVPAADWLQPREIQVDRVNVAPELVEATEGEQIERGKRRPMLDGVGWVFGIPARIILWDRRVENHAVSADTELAMREYLEANGLDHVKVRINQYAPLDDWRRLRANKTVGWGYRYTIGALSVAGEALLPGRVFGGDHYNPFTGTIHLYSDVPAIALHEGGHAKDFTRRRYPGTYSLVTAVPFGSLWPEAIATGDAIAYVERQNHPDLERESYRILFPAYGTYFGGSIGDVASPVALPVYAGAIVAGHTVGRIQAARVPDPVSVSGTAGDETSPGRQVAHETRADELPESSDEAGSRGSDFGSGARSR